VSAASKSTARRFVLDRKTDATGTTGTSGTGLVAEGVEFSDGTCVLHWLTQFSSVALYANIATLERIHGHEGATVVRWVD
jgi:hypothetical protein